MSNLTFVKPAASFVHLHLREGCIRMTQRGPGTVNLLFRFRRSPALAALFLLLAVQSRPQLARPLPAAKAAALEATTAERLDSEPWWPTKSTLPLNAYAGSPSCIGCHRGMAGAQQSAMQHASTRAQGARFLKADSIGPFQSGPMKYTLDTGPEGITYSVADGPNKVSHPLDWVMGAGDLGYTFLFQADSHWVQSQVTYYTRLATLDITTGLGRSSGSGLPRALGTALSAADARSCFGCHTVHATTAAGFEPLHAEAGLGCEACHGPGAQHMRNMADAGPNAGTSPAPAVFNPADLSPSDSIDFCGACHRTSADAKLSTGTVTATTMVRFQPYRLEKSLCWRRTEDKRLTCVACHNPHQPLVRDDASYDKNCLGCHSPHPAGASTVRAASQPAEPEQPKVCPQATSKCVSCHMPKVPVESMHGEFTDHFIRIAKAGEILPQ